MSFFEGTNYQANREDKNLPMFDKIDVSNKILKVERLQSGNIMFTVQLLGINFTRISHRDLMMNVVWTDIDSHFGQRDLMSKAKEEEIESIFRGMLTEYVSRLIN